MNCFCFFAFILNSNISSTLVVPHDVPAGFGIGRWASAGAFGGRYRLLASPLSDRFAVTDDGVLMTVSRLDDDVMAGHPQPLRLYLAQDAPAISATHSLHLYVVDPQRQLHFTAPLYRYPIKKPSVLSLKETLHADIISIG